jgi:hypothetical protein
MALEREKVPTREERAAAHIALDRAATRDAWRSTITGALICLLWMAIGLYGLGWSFHVTDERTGNLLFWGSLVIGNSGIVATIYWVVKKAEARGDIGSG